MWPLMINLILPIIGILCIYVIALWIYQQYKYKDLTIPCPKKLPIIGNVFEFEKSPEGFLNGLYKLSKTYGGIYKLHLGPTITYVVISDPKYLPEILNSTEHVNKSSMYNVFEAVAKNGIVTLPREVWRARRKLYANSFSLQAMNKYLQTFNAVSNQLIEYLRRVNGDIVDFEKYSTLATLHIILETGMGVEFNKDINYHLNYSKNFHAFGDYTMIRYFSLWKRYNCLFQFSPDYEKQQSHIKYVNDYGLNIIKMRSNVLKTKEESNGRQFDDGIETKKTTIVLDRLIDLYNKGEITLDEIRSEVNTFTFAGHDTSATSLSFLIYELSRNPIIQSRLYDEVAGVINGKSEKELTMQQLNDMKYLECVIKETLRRYPILPFFDRCLDQDLQIGGLTIPKNTNIGIFTYGIHLSDKYYPEPTKFDPDRFLKQNCRNRHPLAFIPFSHGPRGCIGNRFAMLVLKCITAKIISNFHIINDDPEFEIELQSNSVLTSKNGYGSIRFLAR